MNLDKMTPEMEDLDNIIHLTDEAGNDCSFEFLDLLEYNDSEYIVLLPVDDDVDELLILQVEDSDRDEESYIGVEDQDILQTVFHMFKEKFKDEFSFID